MYRLKYQLSNAPSQKRYRTLKTALEAVNRHLRTDDMQSVEIVHDDGSPLTESESREFDRMYYSL